MSNILQVTTPNLNTDNRNILNPQDPRQAGQAIHNPVDPTRVVRADGRDGEQTGNSTQDDLFSVINYDSNYGAFVKGLGENSNLSGVMERLLFGDMAGLKGAEQAEVSALVERFLMSMRMDSPQDLLEYLQGQGELQARFSGDFFNKLRSLLSQSPSERLKEAVLNFVKGYNNYSSGAHLLQQMKALTDDIEHLLLRAYREEFRGLADSMNWDAANGDTEENSGILNQRLIPFLSSYISRTHDYGAVREAAMLLIFHAVRYQNGGKDRLFTLFDSLLGNRDFGRLFKGDAEADMEQLLMAGTRESQPPLSEFADDLATLLLKGANGHGGLENVQQFYNIMNGMLINESVYMPLLHFILPFQYEDNNVMSEMWVDPDSKKDSEEEGRKIKLFLKFDIQTLGKFELVMTLQDRQSKVQLYVPPQLARQNKQIQTEVADILKKNGFRFSQLLIRERVRDRRVDEVFPEIREKERTINVRI
ncbi:MAG: hypothetical protein HFG54_03860 [Lachnospiraceae bacterium]|jgi:hypothetical protein|nr:hypothetical protein [Lachnospiraceae bacterium]